MQNRAIDELQPGMTLARPVRDPTGNVIHESGTALTRTMIADLTLLGVQELSVSEVDEPADEPTVPPYMDRYGADFATKLQDTFHDAMVNRTMQELFLRALDHAAHCYRQYRVTNSKTLGINSDTIRIQRDVNKKKISNNNTPPGAQPS